MRRAAVLAIAPSRRVRPIRAALGRDAALELVGVSRDARDGLEAVDRFSPDLLLLDAALEPDVGPVLFAALARRRSRPVLVVVGGPDDTVGPMRPAASPVAERFTHDGRAVTDDALADTLERELLPRLHALFARARASAVRGSGHAAGSARRPGPHIRLLTIGVSTGGPEALVTLLGALPGTLPVPVAVVQHMPATFVPKLARRLDEASALHVTEAGDGASLLPGTVHIAPTAVHMHVESRYGELVSRLEGTVPENACCPAVDVLFRSAANALGPAALGLVMTGMGRDGYLGSRALVQSGAPVIVQDEPSSVVWGMPGLVARAGLACATVPLEGLANEVLRRVGHPVDEACAGAVAR